MFPHLKSIKWVITALTKQMVIIRKSFDGIPQKQDQLLKLIIARSHCPCSPIPKVQTQENGKNNGDA